MSQPETMVDYLEHWARTRPDALSQRFLDVEGRELESYTFGAFAERTRELAAFLSREAGLVAGDRVLLVYPPGLELNVAFFACARLGVIAVPAGAPLPTGFEAGIAKLAYIAADSGARAVLCTRMIQQAFQMMTAGTTTLPGAAALAALPFIATEESRGYGGPRADDTPIATLFLQYTSGSTRDPRGVIVSHRNLVHNAHATLDRPHVGVSWLPQHHDMGLIGYYLFPMVLGGVTHGFSPMDFLRRPALWLKTLGKVGGTHTIAPNFAYDYCLRPDKLADAELAGVDLGSVTHMYSAAEPVRAATVERFYQRFAPFGLRRAALMAGYGLAEFTLSVSFGGRKVVRVNKQALQGGELRIEKAAPHNNNQVQVVSCGAPVGEGTHVRIVDPVSHAAHGEERIGEIWLDGPSKTGGYWRRPELSAATFAARITGNCGNGGGEPGSGWLRTGDLGFLHEGELYLCGRLKDMIIVRGVNYYPHDIEALVESACPEVRTGCVAAFPADDRGEGAESLVVVAELKEPRAEVVATVDPAAIARALRARYFVDAATIALVPPRTVPKTTSGKVSRHRARALWEGGAMTVLARHDHDARSQPRSEARFAWLAERYGLTGAETCPITDVGIDSLATVELITEVQALLEEHGAGHLSRAIDTRMVQRLTVAELFGLAARFAADPARTIESLGDTLAAIRGEYDAYEAARMRDDRRLVLPAISDARAAGRALPLLTGVTGFLGPFLLRAILHRGEERLRVLVRAAAPGHGMDRVVATLARARILTPALEAEVRRRVEILCGDLGQPRLGLDEAAFDRLGDETGAIYHNGALVNYVMSYDALRAANVEGTRELLRLAARARRATFHLVSSTFIYGWMVTPVVGEDERNDGMGNLDFGYSQSKWVAEQLAYEGARQGLDVRVYRPSLIAPTAAGFGSREDVILRLLAFMIEHGVAVRAENQVSLLPADLVAEHIAGIAALPGRSGDTFNLTSDHYYTLPDITRRVTALYGRRFEYFDIPGFIAQMNRRCTARDPLYPLVDFLNRSYPKIEAMQDKRYDNRRYRVARTQAARSHDRVTHEEPSLDATVTSCVEFMRQAGMVAAPR